MVSSHLRRAAPVAIAVVGLLPGVAGPYIHDDLTNLGLVFHDVGSIAEALDVSLSNESGILRRPLSNASFLLSYLLTGPSPLGIKAANVLLHAMCGVMLALLGIAVLGLLRPATDERERITVGLLGAAMWAAHPLQVSTVLYAVQRMTILSSLLMVAALLVYCRALQAQQRLWTPVAVIGLLAVLAALAKETAAVLPLYLLAVFAFAQADVRSGRKARVISLVVIGLPVIAGIALLVVGWDGLMQGYAWRNFSPSERLATEAVVLFEYLTRVLVPAPQLMHFYWDATEVRQPLDAAVVLATIGWIGLLGLSFALRRSWPLFGFAVCWFLFGHALESSIVPLELAYEHRNYLPMFGPMLLLASIVASALRNLPADRRRAAVIAIVGGMVLLTATRAAQWASMDRIIAHELDTSPQSSRAIYAALDLAAQRNDWHQSRLLLSRLRANERSIEWLKPVELSLQCGGLPAGAAPATSLMDIDASAIDDLRVKRGVQQLVNLTVSASCPDVLSIETLQPAVVRLAELAHERDLGAIAADYWYMAGALAWAAGDLIASEQLVERSLAAAEAGEAHEQLIMIQLALDKPDAALLTLDRLEKFYRSHAPWRLYRIGDLRRAIISTE